MTAPSLRQFAFALGGDVAGLQVLAPGPGHSPADRSMSVRFHPDARDGFVVTSFAGDDWRACRDYVRERLRLPGWQPGRDAEPRERRVPTTRPSDERPLALWRAAGDPLGTVVERYLTSRGLLLSADVAMDAIRFHPSCPFDGSFPACMIALYRDIVTDEPVAIHRTALTPEAAKLGRKMLGPVRGAAIKLDGDEAVTAGLVIGEGIETCLAARQIGFRPVWALGSAGAIAAFPVLPGIEALTILGEHDAANAKAVQACANRWSAAGRQVIVVLPAGGKDVNDALRAAA
ncbi:MAG: toprim domain-containing protein [Hyphomicrobiales bacterium]